MRDDIHVASIEISNFEDPPTPLSIYVQNFHIPLTLYVQF